MVILTLVRLDVRLKEHERAFTINNQNNGIAVHANKTLHDIQWDSAEVLKREHHDYIVTHYAIV